MNPRRPAYAENSNARCPQTARSFDDKYRMASLYDNPPDIGFWRQAYP